MRWKGKGEKNITFNHVNSVEETTFLPPVSCRVAESVTNRSRDGWWKGVFLPCLAVFVRETVFFSYSLPSLWIFSSLRWFVCRVQTPELERVVYPGKFVHCEMSEALNAASRVCMLPTQSLAKQGLVGAWIQEDSPGTLRVSPPQAWRWCRVFGAFTDW